MQYENSRRYTKEGATIEEFDIANNGPNIANYNTVVKETIGRSQGDSEVMDRTMNTENNLPFTN